MQRDRGRVEKDKTLGIYQSIIATRIKDKNTVAYHVRWYR